ncbi:MULTISPECIES: aldo/keto reductase [Haloferax]|uniref:Aldo/keto reductase n=2 Tax=Haloferax TaxID=2251 RepID=A0A6G1Z5S2_9EURY|nr:MULTISPECIES: aldo/keto reductase [Haloferax]KAB1189163.1 aldo/keto reductase [Haloferax sp. CBA1149]MRW81900.1 aldo/keto reductase [Haloferax marinisediminis]
MATGPGTWAYRDRFGDSFGRTFFRRFGPGVVSSIGIGTYLGEPTDEVDDRYHESLVLALESGINLVDTASNYRHGRSERVVGDALRDADIDRDAVVVASKAGFVPFDRSRPDNPGAYIRETVLDSGLASADELAHGSHTIAPNFVDEMVDRSLDLTGLDHIDLYYLHNPETQLAITDRETVYDRIEAAFEVLERRVAADDIGRYGVASWEAFRVAPDHDSYLSLPEVVRRAERAAETVGNEESGLEAIQLPFNVVMADAFTADVHETEAGELTSALWYAHEHGLHVFTSASLAQGDLATEIPEAVDGVLSGDTFAQRALNFSRSAPGVTAALVGASSPEHVAENVAAGTFDPLGARVFDSVFE